MAEFVVDYDYYTKEYGSSAIPEGDWKCKEREARKVVENMTYGRIYKYELIEKDVEAVKWAICAAAEKQYSADQIGNIQREDNDGYAMTYRSQRGTSREVASLVSLYLASTTLLDKGVQYDYKR